MQNNTEEKAPAPGKRQGQEKLFVVGGDHNKKRARKKERAKWLDFWGKRPSYLGLAKGANLPVALLLPSGRVVGFPTPGRRTTGKAAGPNGSLLIVNDTAARGRFVERFGRGAFGFFLARVDHAIIATPRRLPSRAEVLADARAAYLTHGESARLEVLRDAAEDMRIKAKAIRELYSDCLAAAVKHGRHSTLVETSGAPRADQWRRYFERRGVEVELRPESLP